MYRSLGLFKNTRPLYLLSWSIDLGKIDPIKLSKCTHAYAQHLCCSVNYRVCSELPWGHLWIGVKLMNFFSAARCSTGTPLNCSSLMRVSIKLVEILIFSTYCFFLDDIKDTISKLNSLVFKAKLPHLWSEAAIIKRVVYRNGNQHRKQFYFQGLKRVLSWLNWMYIWDKYFPFLQLSFVPQQNRTSFTFLYAFLFTDC